MMNNSLLLTLVFVLIVFCFDAQSQQMSRPQLTDELFLSLKQKDEFDKRSRILLTNEKDSSGLALTKFIEQYKTNLGQMSQNERDTFLIDLVVSVSWFLCRANTFWNDNVFQKETFSNHMARLSLIPQTSAKEWTDAITKVEGKEIQRAYYLGSIIVQDRLFDSKGFKQEESQKLLARLALIPQDAVQKWADAHQLFKHQAAISLINDDSLFAKETFNQGLFTKKLAAATPK